MYRLSNADVERAAAKVEPRSTEKYAVMIGGRAFPPKQLIEVSLHLPPMAFTTMDAQRILTRLGFEVVSLDRQPAPETALQRLETSPASKSHSQDLWELAVSGPQDDRALRLKTWLRDTWLETRAKDLFESYLFASGLGKSALQREPQDGGAIPDFILPVRGKRIAIEVKELVALDFDIASEVGLYDPCRPIRERIMAAEYQLGGMRDASRCLILYSRCTPWPIFDWRLIYGAMRDSGEMIGRETENRTTEERTEEGSGPRPLDAVIVLDQLRTGYLRFRAHVTAQESKLSRPLSDTEYVSELHKARGTERDIMLSRLRVIVHEHPQVQNPLPKDVFRGSYDEWYGAREDGQIGRTFVGEELQSLEKDNIRNPLCP